MTKILAIDPGYGRLGYAVCDDLKPIEYDTIETIDELSFTIRLHLIVEEVDRLIKVHRPVHVAIEIPVMTMNSINAGQVNEAIGAIRMILFQVYKKELKGYNPSQIKKIVTGNGKAKKTDIKKAVCRIYGIPYKGLIDDSADALAINYTHLWTLNMNDQIAIQGTK